MRQEYQNAYLDAVRAMAESGMTVQLLNGRELRARSGEAEAHSSERYMSREFSQQVAAICHGSLALSEMSADQLIKRDQGETKTATTTQRAKTTS
ncbi:hypothetical protein [Marinobacter sp. GH_1]|uniref:hypothetical protein n=1 Tax=Marinobacter sp. GH_1 TaxID=3402164 RepID=UPI003B43AA82